MEELAAIAMDGLVSIMAILIPVLTGMAIRWVKNRTDTEAFHQALDQIDVLADSEVKRFSESVKTKLEDGALTKEEAQAILREQRANVEKNLSKKALKILKKAGVNSVGELVEGRIEGRKQEEF